MSVLVDTNVLLRLARPKHHQYQVALSGVARARRAGETLYVTPQNIAEFWAAATHDKVSRLQWAVGVTPQI